MTNGKILVGVLGLTLFFLVTGLVRSFFQFPEDQVKYNLLYVRVEGSYENLSLSFVACPRHWPYHDHANQIYTLVLLSLGNNNSPKQLFFL